MQAEITPAAIAEVLNVPALRGMSIAQALQSAKAERIDRAANFRYWALRGASGRGYRIACARIESIEYVLRVLEAAQRIEAARAATLLAPVEIAPQREARAPREAQARCPFYRAIRRAYAIMREAGLNPKAEAAMRAAFARYLGREIESRESLSGGDWLLLGDAIKGNRLAW